jgi:hypothetical protein
MNNPTGYADFGYGVFLNPANYSWYQSLDPTFPPYAMIDITPAGVVLRGTDAYPAVRAAMPKTVSGQAPFLSSYLTAGYAAHIGIPYARRVRFTISSGNYDFPGVWGYGSHEVGGSGTGYEIDDFERFCTDNPPGWTAQSTHIAGVDDGGRRDTGASLLGGVVIETVIVHHSDFIYLFTNGVLTKKVTVPAGASPTDTHHAILNMAVGAGWESYPAGSIGNPTLTVQSVEILAPPSNTTGVFPPAPPTPVITWATGFAGGVLHTPPAGTIVATLSGAATYRLIPYLSTFTGLAVSGSNIVTVGTLAVGSYDFYIEGTDASGMPCLAAKQTATVTAAQSLHLQRSSCRALPHRILTTASTWISSATRFICARRGAVSESTTSPIAAIRSNRHDYGHSEPNPVECAERRQGGGKLRLCGVRAVQRRISYRCQPYD